MTIKSSVLISLLLSFCTATTTTVAFSGIPTPSRTPISRTSSSSSSSSSSSTRTSFILYARKQQVKKGIKTKSGSGGFGGSSGGGSGFASKKKDTATNLDGKIRSVSGFSGSGTKPLRAAANTFDAIRKEYGKECCNDVYVKNPDNDKDLLWFVGKVAYRLDTVATSHQAVISQKRLILEYAKRELRPQNLAGPKYESTLQIWLAPGDSEMDAVQNKVNLEQVTGTITDLHDEFTVSDVGYNPEIYVGDEIQKGGLRIKRDDEGKPINDVFEINQSL